MTDYRPEPDWTRDDDLRADIFDDDHGTGRDWTPPHGIERPYKADDYCRVCDGAGNVYPAGEVTLAKCPRCKGTGHI